jgi:hypothetical protein
MVGSRIDPAAQIDGDGAPDSDSVLTIVDAAAVGQDVDIRAFGPELAVSLWFVTPSVSTTSPVVPRYTKHR